MTIYDHIDVLWSCYQDQAGLEKERDEKIEALKKSGCDLYWFACGVEDFVYQSAVHFEYVYRESTWGYTWLEDIPAGVCTYCV